MKFIGIFVFAFVAGSAYGCKDIAPNCATLAALCNLYPPTPYVQENCAQTCGCASTEAPCVDNILNCMQMFDTVCKFPEYIDFALENCRLTCNYCGIALPDLEPTQPSDDCVDVQDGTCEQLYKMCNVPSYKPLMEQECPKVIFHFNYVLI
uniref:ShKT domain-containing protein n=1 Tax=Rhabditophanes sp. KR3021 TaxID=114890 RepID=A0AC35TYE2_9BILA